MKITVLYSAGGLFEVHRAQKIADADTLTSAKQIAGALAVAGYEVEIVKVTPTSIDDVKNIKTDVFFNLCEWTGNDYFLNMKVLKLLGRRKIPFTGADYFNYKWSSDKVMMKRLFDKHDIRTPGWVVVKNRLTDLQIKKLKKIGFPLIVKPALEHCSIGVHQDSVVDNVRQLRVRVEDYLNKFNQPILIEEYIEGREIHVTAIKNGHIHILPPAEILFLKKKNKRKIFTFESKWEKTGSKRSVFAKTIIPELNKKVHEQISGVCNKVFEKMAGKGYMRFDFRMRKGQIYLLEVNANPSLTRDPEYTVTVSAEAQGWDFDKLVLEIVKAGSDIGNENRCFI